MPTEHSRRSPSEEMCVNRRDVVLPALSRSRANSTSPDTTSRKLQVFRSISRHPASDTSGCGQYWNASVPHRRFCGLSVPFLMA